MSSRSFRRRNSRRRRRQGAAPGGAPGGEGVPPEGTPPEAAETGSQGGAGRHGRPQGNRSPGGRPQGRPKGGHGQGGRPQPSRVPGGHPAGGGAPEAVVREPAAPIELPDCPICGKQVRELASALTHRLSGKPAHFDCIVRELRESNEIAPQEKLCYLGGGSFGILEFRAPGGSTRFVIKKRIQYEEKETPQDWKKPLQYPC